ncbi:hypothetical protein V8B97DRAFT_1361800 [Scleroderma yunnanense]
MALNERNTGGNKGVGAYPSIAKPIPHSSPSDPAKVTVPITQERGRSAEFRSDRDAKRAMRRYSGVIEGHPGIIESTHIEPLDEDYNVDEAGLGRAMGQSTPMQAQNLKGRITTVAEGTANIVYGIATGDQKAKQVGKKALGLDK